MEDGIRPCGCVNVECGSYDNQVTLARPDHMRAPHRSELICVDRCIAPEIEELWAQGIHTTGCCCGHNKLRPYIGVLPEDIQRMREMGYVVQPNPCRPGDEDSFWPQRRMVTHDQAA